MSTVDFGVNVIAGATVGQPPIQVDSEIVALFGAFPVDKLASPSYGKPDQWYRCLNWEDYKNKYGFEELWGAGNLNRSDGWNAVKSAQTIMDTFGVYPVLIRNVLDPAVHKTDIVDESITFVATTGQTQPVVNKYGMTDTVVVTDDPMTLTYTEGDDYTIELVDSVLQITRVSTGAIGEADSVLIDYSYCDPTLITDTHVATAIDSVSEICTTLGFAFLPGWLHAPGWTQKDQTLITKAATRAKLLTKKNGMNDSLFPVRSVYDLDQAAFESSEDLQDLFDDKTVSDEFVRCFFGNGTTADKTEQLLSDWFLGTISQKVAENGFPGITPSNTVLSGYIPDYIPSFPTQSNAIRAKGITTLCANPNDRGWALWGSYTSYFDGTATDLSLDDANQNDIFCYLSKLLTRDIWEKNTDRPLTPSSVSDQLDKWKLFGRTKVSQGKMIGWELQFRPEDNPDLTQNVVFRIHFLAPVAQKRTDLILQVNLGFLNNLFPA